LLSKERLARIFDGRILASDKPEILAHIAALEADNAAMVEHAGTERQMLFLLYHRIKALGVHDATDSMIDAVTTVERWMDAVPDTHEKPHPGAALLEEHRKALADMQHALEQQQGECHTLRRAFLHERHRADAAGAPPEHAYNARWAENLVADERKALVRARNEGLEKAARVAGDTGAAWDDKNGGINTSTGPRLGAIAKAIRALKEPEECVDASCAQCRSGEPCR
jgi:hypothetical protein